MAEGRITLIEEVIEVAIRNRSLVEMLVVRRSKGESYEEIAKVIPRSIPTLRRWAREFHIEIDDMKCGRWQ